MKTLRPLANQLSSAPAQVRNSFVLRQFARPTTHNLTARRPFLTNPFSETPQTISASRTLPYPVRVIYDIISDVNAYSSFIPYCHSSRVTKTSKPAATTAGRTWPEEAELVVGLNSSMSEAFWSRIYCAPYEAIETVCGPQTETSLRPEQIAHHSARPAGEDDPTRSAGVLAHLRTRWAFRPYHYKPPPSGAAFGSPAEATKKNLEEMSDVPGQDKTEVSLVIEYQLTNPVYAALSQAAAPQVADKVIEAFETRVRMVMEGRAHVTDRR